MITQVQGAQTLLNCLCGVNKAARLCVLSDCSLIDPGITESLYQWI